jgi:hypothetical protein
MTTATLTKYQPVLDMDAVEAIKAIKGADDALKSAKENLETRLLATPSIFASKVSDTDLAKAAEVSKATVSIYRRIGKVIEMKVSEGVKPSDVQAVINMAYNAQGSLVKNVDAVLAEYCRDNDTHTWAGAISAIKKNLKPETTPKTDAEKFDAALDKAEALVKKAYVPTAEQKARLTALGK